MPKLIRRKSVWDGLEWGGMGWCGVEWGGVEWKEAGWGGVGREDEGGRQKHRFQLGNDEIHENLENLQNRNNPQHPYYT